MKVVDYLAWEIQKKKDTKNRIWGVLGIAVVVSLIVAYYVNNSNNLPDFVFWAFPKSVWASVDYHLLLPLACFIVIGIPLLIVSELIRRTLK